MSPEIEQLLKYFILFFVVIEPISLVPMFGALTRGLDAAARRRTAFKAVAISTVIFLVFALTGSWLLSSLGISVSAFKIAGGLLLFLLAVDMVFARDSGVRSATVREQEEARFRQDVSVFPVAFPLIAGPGALATVLLIVVDIGSMVMFAGMLGVLALVLLITIALLLLTTPVMRIMGVTGGNVISRLAGVVLAALAAQYVLDGVLESLA